MEAEVQSPPVAARRTLPRLSIKRLLAFAVLLGIGVLLQRLFFPIHAPIAVSTPVCGTWHISAAPLTGFTAVSALSRSDVWFAGVTGGLLRKQEPAFQRRQGLLATTMPSFGPSADSVEIRELAVRTEDDAWAVGSILERKGSRHYWVGEGKTIALHWDGSQWKDVPTADSFTDASGKQVTIKSGSYDEIFGGPEKHADLMSVTTISENDVWAVGQYFDDDLGAYRTLTEHWNGREWEVVLSPNMGRGDNYLSAVVSLSANDIWAFGQAQLEGTTDAWQMNCLTMHWDGKSWSIVESPSEFRAVGAATVTPTEDIWVVGDDLQGKMYSAIRERGSSSWRTIPIPYIQYPHLASVSAVAKDDVWAVGHKWSGYPPNANSSQIGSRTLVVHWDGTSWREVPGPDPSWIQALDGVAAAAKDDIWVVGITADDEDGLVRAMTAHFIECPLDK